MTNSIPFANPLPVSWQRLRRAQYPLPNPLPAIYTWQLGKGYVSDHCRGVGSETLCQPFANPLAVFPRRFLGGGDPTPLRLWARRKPQRPIGDHHDYN